MKQLALIGVTLALLAGCGETAARMFPQTTAGYEAGGILGAIDGATGAILARCKLLDGTELRVAIDGGAALAGQTLTVAGIRAARQLACAELGNAKLVGDALLAPVPVETPDGPAPVPAVPAE